ncbi:MAG TPA: tetratricopeptide repeat protein [Polyangia bacterium]
MKVPAAFARLSAGVSRALRPLVALGGRRLLIWGALASTLALVLDFVPLFDLLGYDFSFAIGLLAAFASVDIGCGVAARARGAGQAPDVFRVAARAAALALSILILPLLLSLANALRVRNCNIVGGLAFFALLPAASAWYGAGAGVIAGSLFARRARLVAFALPVLSILWTLWRLYCDPPVFALDPFGGYFPGPIYDEALRAPPALVAYRGVNLVWIVAGLALVRALPRSLGGRPDPARGRAARVAFAAVLVAAAGVLFQARGALGFHVRHADLLRFLDGERHSNRIILRYATSTGIKPAELALAMEDLEFRYDQLRDTLGVEPRGPITIYDFPNAETKKAMVGAAATLYAKPWTREIFVQAWTFPSNRLRHEMAHVFAGEFGDPLFGIALTVTWKGPLPVPRLASGLVEGIAEAADYTDADGGSTTHQEAAAIIADGRAPPLADVIGAGFSTISGPRAYTLAGSFCRFLLDTRGAERLRAVYRSAGDFAGVYGEPLSALEVEWRRFLAKQPMSAEQRARAREQFRRPAIFKKVCAREQAARVQEARGLLAGAPARAARLLERACADDPKEPTLQVELAQALAAAGETARAHQLLGGVARDGDATAPVRARAAGLAASLYFHAGDDDNARVALREVLTSATDEGERRTAAAKLRALEDEPARRTLGRALFGDDVLATLDAVLAFDLMIDFARLHPGDPLGPYLIGRQLAMRDPLLALPYLRNACEQGAGGAGPAGQAPAGGQTLGEDFVRECLRMTALAAFKLGDLQRSQAAAMALRRSAADEAERLRADDFLARIAWRRSKS